ncbi:unnamed protein product [Orchesella dallaii]|uniref:Wiskott-Aldrich syndrome protein family member n=1 Tax=Orchesella dallaii TaxID=48710 RepID=A0ABP1Q281_9HEXA
MPLGLRRVRPTHVSKNVLPENVRVPNDLEATANGTLANVIRQLSSLSHHAEELFSSLIQAGSEITNRANNLQARMEKLAVKVAELDGDKEELASMQESLNTKPFQSSTLFDQQVVARPTLPPALLKTYHLCGKPPPLDKLNVFRDDGKDGLKFYADPNYFFDLWRQEMLKDSQKGAKKLHKPKNEGRQRQKNRVRQPGNTRERYKNKALQHGELIMSSPEVVRSANVVSEVPDGVLPTEAKTSSGNVRERQARGSIRKHPSSHSGTPTRSMRGVSSRDTLPPPPPPPTELEQTELEILELLQSLNTDSEPNGHASMPPPPPPPGELDEPLPPPPPTPDEEQKLIISTIPEDQLPPPPEAPAPPRLIMRTRPPPPPMMNAPPPPPPTKSESSLRISIDPPPPPPIISDSTLRSSLISDSPPPPPLIMDESSLRSSIISAPPPPPPIMSAPPPPPPFMSAPPSPIVNGSMVKAAKKNVPAPAIDGRSDLLKAIRDGFALRKVEKKEVSGKDDKACKTYCDVASILARRVALEMSDNDSESESEEDSDSWDEASN